MDISSKTDTELKALAFDQLKDIERAQGNLQLINQELTRRQLNQPAPDETEDLPTEEIPENPDTPLE
jgi:hypothetical protein